MMPVTLGTIIHGALVLAAVALGVSWFLGAGETLFLGLSVNAALFAALHAPALAYRGRRWVPFHEPSESPWKLYPYLCLALAIFLGNHLVHYFGP
jgi:hypothetical protein